MYQPRNAQQNRDEKTITWLSKQSLKWNSVAIPGLPSFNVHSDDSKNVQCAYRAVDPALMSLTKSSKCILLKQKLPFLTIYHQKGPRHVNDGKSESIQNLYQTFQLLDCERFSSVLNIPRPVDICRCKTRDWVQSTHSRAYSTYQRTRM